jgi:hypothetical protein
MKKGTPEDPKALIAEAYRIDGITTGECRSILLDWALSLPDGADSRAVLALLVDRYADAPDHPMTAVMREGVQAMTTRGRRGGWRSRPRD